MKNETCPGVDTVVSADDATLGFSANDAMALLDTRTWNVAWSPVDASGATLTTTFSLGTGDVVLRDPGGEWFPSCSFEGPVLFVPVTVTIEDAEGTLVASGPDEVAVDGPTEADVHLSESPHAPLVYATTYPEGLTDSVEHKFDADEGDAIEHVRVSLHGTLAAPEISVSAGNDFHSASITGGVLTPVAR